MSKITADNHFPTEGAKIFAETGESVFSRVLKEANLGPDTSRVGLEAMRILNTSPGYRPSDAARIFARACRLNPRQLNTYVRNAESLSAGEITGETAIEVVRDLNSTTLDGLTRPMQGMLRCLLMNERVSKGETVYRASVNTIATAVGFSRDTKNVALYVEPWLLAQGLVRVSPQGRELTTAGVARARRLT